MGNNPHSPESETYLDHAAELAVSELAQRLTDPLLLALKDETEAARDQLDKAGASILNATAQLEASLPGELREAVLHSLRTQVGPTIGGELRNAVTECLRTTEQTVSEIGASLGNAHSAINQLREQSATLATSIDEILRVEQQIAKSMKRVSRWTAGIFIVLISATALGLLHVVWRIP